MCAPSSELLKPDGRDSSIELEPWNKKDKRKRLKSRWMLIGFGKSVEVKVDEEEQQGQTNSEKEEKPDQRVSWDSFYDPICNLGIGRKGGLIQYLRMVGQETSLRHSSKSGQTTTAKTGSCIAKSVRELFHYPDVVSTRRTACACLDCLPMRHYSAMVN